MGDNSRIRQNDAAPCRLAALKVQRLILGGSIMFVRCGARLRFNIRTYERLNARDPAHAVRYLRRSGGQCKRPPVAGSTRCRLHGGCSTGPKTPEGKARSNAAATMGRARWVVEWTAKGQPFPCGRKKGGRNLPLQEREQLAVEKRRRRQARILLRELRAARRRERVHWHTKTIGEIDRPKSREVQ